ncbi:MAG TPA: hypothetical protein VHD88_01085 [Pyrinomonadaceae bacterium]|nr:hypothetical protein [Pyrinomonadaceae bacterium]
MKYQLTPDLIQRAFRQTAWDFGNNILYELCAKYPDHLQDDVIIAKVWLIGRSYAAAIERRLVNPLGAIGDAFYENVVAPRIRTSRIKEWFDSLTADSDNSLLLSLEVHKKVTELFSEISGMEKRSLASKYLHFHFPQRFYIFDSRAQQAITKLTRSVGKTMPSKGAHDNQYALFCFRCEALNDDVHKLIGRRLTPRELDKVLLTHRGTQQIV